jgi:hypothetical protein
VTTPLFSPGFDGVVEVQNVDVKDTKLGTILIVGLEVVVSNMTEHPPGWRGIWFLKLFDPDVVLALVLEFVEACEGRGGGVFLRLPSIAQLLDKAKEKKGSRLRLRTEQRATKGGTQWTQYTFERLLRVERTT